MPYNLMNIYFIENNQGLFESAGDFKHLVIVGPSGAGKDTLIRNLIEAMPGFFGFVCSYTTRQPREGEINGKHFHFVTKEKFQEMIKDDAFIEYC